jgi:chromosome segregation ATPase
MKTNEICKKVLKTTLSLIIMALLILMVGSCQNPSKQKKNDISKEDVEKEIEEAAETTGAYLSEKRQKIINDLEAQMDKAGEEIGKLKQQISSVSDNVKEEYKEKINSLEAQRDKAQKKADQLKKSSSDAWDEIKEGVEMALTELDKSIEEVKSEFESN